MPVITSSGDLRAQQPRLRWNRLNRILGCVLIVLTMLVAAPLSFKTYRDGGGP